MKLWTIQSPEAWELLSRTGSLTCPFERITEGFSASYGWLIEQMELRLNTRRPDGCSTLWGWKLYEGKSELTVEDVQYYALPEGEPGYLIGIEVPEETVLLSDFMSWHSVLNGCYLSLTEDEDDEFDRRLEAAGFRCPVIDSVPSSFQQEIRESWNRIFDLHSVPGWLHGADGLQDVQATFFRLNAEQVRSAEPFVGIRAPDDSGEER